MLDPRIRLRKAIVEGNLPITKRLLQRFPDLWLNIDPDAKGWCNLHYASYHGNYLICFHLVTLYRNRQLQISRRMFEQESHSDSGSEIDDTDDSIQSSTTIRAYDYLDMLTFDGLSVLHLPCMTHQLQTLHYLLKEFPGRQWLNHRGGPDLQTPLHYACRYGFKEGLKLLLEFEADYNLVDEQGNTCLHVCFQYGHINCIESLLQFVLAPCQTKEETDAALTQYELKANAKGWVAVDMSATFRLQRQYKKLKVELMQRHSELQRLMKQQQAQEQNDYEQQQEQQQPHEEVQRPHKYSISSFPLTPPFVHPLTGLLEGVSSTDFSPLNSAISTFSESLTPQHENGVLASPVVPVLMAKLDPKSFSQSRAGKARAYLLTLPNGANAEVSSSSMSMRPLALRQRSSTSAAQSSTGSRVNPPNNSFRLPLTPIPEISRMAIKTQTPSLKSVAISPQVRNTDQSLKLALMRNQSSKHSSLSESNSPKATIVLRKSFSSAGGLPGAESLRNSPQALDFAKTMQLQRQAASSVSFSRRSSSSSSSSIAAKIAFASGNSSKYSLGTFADSESPRRTSLRASPNKEIPPLIRKAKSTTMIPPAVSELSLPSMKWTSTASFKHIPGASTDDLTRQQVSNVAFNRVGR